MRDHHRLGVAIDIEHESLNPVAVGAPGEQQDRQDNDQAGNSRHLYREDVQT